MMKGQNHSIKKKESNDCQGIYDGLYASLIVLAEKEPEMKEARKKNQ